jgi:tRNA A37 N6-isopentenylltransferase MiaA
VEEVRVVTGMIGDAEMRRHGHTVEKRISTSPVPCFAVSSLPSLQAIGYKEIALYLEGEITLEEAVRLVKRGSKRYAKRQFTWFKKEEGIHWIDITSIHDNVIIFNLISEVLSNILKH